MAILAQAQTEDNNYISIGISNSLIISGEQNATYNITHALQANYSYAISKRISLLPEIGYLLSPYNKNFKLASVQALAGLEYRIQDLKAISIQLGYEYSYESYAFKFQETLSEGTMNNSGMVIKAAASFPISNQLKIQPFVEIIPRLRTSIGFRVAYFILKTRT
jgi:hypothetical protein